MTKKLYDEDGYLTEFDGEVVACYQVEQLYHVELNQTAFFPEEGGQEGDRGTLGGQVVINTIIEQETVYHVLEHPLEVGAKVHGKIFWNTRFYNMQHHTGEHIFSGLVYQKYGYENVGFHLSTNRVTIDVGGVLNEQQLEALELEVNKRIVWQIPVEASYPTKERLDQMNYRSKKMLEGPIRIVNIEGCDSCACCAPHVHNTGEVGSFHIVDYIKYKKGIRVEICCGLRAVKNYHKLQKQANQLSGELSVKPLELKAGVLQLRKELEDSRTKYNQANEQIYNYEIDKLPGEIDLLLLFYDNLDKVNQRKLVNAMVERAKGVCGVFVGTEEKGYRYIIGTPNQNGKVINACLAEKFKARGGGSNQMIQGTIIALRDEIISLIEKI